MTFRGLWPAGAATGIGSLPGTDPREAARWVLGEFPDLPHLPELPDRGPGAEMIGRGAGLLVDLPVDVTATGWRFCDRPGRDLRRARDFLEQDLDVFAEDAEGFAGTVKIQVTGPWTLLAGVELRNGEKALSDRGAIADVTASLAQGVIDHVVNVRRRLPDATILVQLDEPSLPAVLAARIRTASGFRTLRAVDAADARDGLRAVIDAVDAPAIVHCCAADVPMSLLREAGAVGVAVDLSLLDLTDTTVLDGLGEHVQTSALFAGLDLGSSPPAAADPLRQVWRRIGLAPELLAEAVVVTPPCGLAGMEPTGARTAMRTCREAGQILREDPEG